MGVPARSLHAAEKAQIGLLRAAVAVARRRDRLGQRDVGERHARGGYALRQVGAARCRVPARARCRARSLAHVPRRRARSRGHRPLMRMSNPALFLTSALIWGSTWLAITFQL